jgi:predicted extracellular nuclease
MKSKGGSGEDENADKLDGQGNWNFRRARGVEALLAFVASDPIGVGVDSSNSPVFLAGDFNAYAYEDPVNTAIAGGYTSVEPIGKPSYSFLFSAQFGTLDYIMVNNEYADNVIDFTTWHVNSGEVDYIDYNFDYGRSKEVFNGTIPYRFSDHDPLAISFLVPPMSATPDGQVSLSESEEPTSSETEVPTSSETEEATNEAIADEEPSSAAMGSYRYVNSGRWTAGMAIAIVAFVM